MLYLCRQLSEVNIFGHENLGEWNEVFSGIVDDMRGVEHTLQKGTTVGAGPVQLGVGVSSRYFQLTCKNY